jgi:major type 1 subunit fimbrin (pilin)
MKKVVVLLAVMPSFVFAAGNTIRFQGQVNDQTCHVMIEGSTDPLVLLPTVAASSLAAVGAVAGERPFTLSVTGCKAPVTDVMSIKTAFAVSSGATDGGNIPNLGTASNVALQLLDQPGGSPIKLASGTMTSVNGLKLGRGETAASHIFAVRYIAEGAAVGAGSVMGAVQYALDYL